MHTFEVPVFSAEAAATAVAHGATRLEINRAGSYAVGGLTPTREEIEAAAAAAAVAATVAIKKASGCSVPLRVMIRPRGRPSGGSDDDDDDDSSSPPDFVYTDAELCEMRASIAALVAADGLLRPDRGDGFVFGVLRRGRDDDCDGDGEPPLLRLDVARCRELVEAARPLACVLHRAFDEVVGVARGAGTEANSSIAEVRDCGFVGVLTAGGVGAHGAVAHGDTLRKLVEEAENDSGNDTSFEIIVGGGVRSRNLPELAQAILPAQTGKEGNEGKEGKEGQRQRQRQRRRRPVAFHSSCLDVGAADGTVSEAVDGGEVARIRSLLEEMGE